jgi:PST family polysaccharide transporter
MAANATINHWSRNLDTVIIGHFLGIVPLGLYNLAQRLVAAPAQFASAGMRPLLHPAFARISNDLPRMRRGYLELVRITALLTFSLSAVLVTVAEPLVLAIAGPRWLGSVPLLRILAVLSALQPVNVLASSLFLTQNAPAVLLKSNIVTAAGLIGGMLAGLRWGTPGVAAGYVIVYVLLVVPCGSLLAYTRLLHGRAIEWLARLALPSAAAAAVLVAGFAADALQPHTSRDVVRLAVIGVADAVALLPFIYLAWRRAQMTS